MSEGWRGMLGFYNNPHDDVDAVRFDLPHHELHTHDTYSYKIHGIIDDFEPGGWYEYIAQPGITQKSYIIGSTRYVVDFTFLPSSLGWSM